MINTQNRLSDHTAVFGGAGERVFDTRGRHVLITAATGDVYVAFDDQKFVKWRKKSNIDAGYTFSRVTIKTLVAQTVEFITSDQRQDEGRDDVAVTVSATIASGDNIVTAPDVSIAATSSGVIVAANANRLAVILKNLTSNAAIIRIGESGGVGAARGHPLDPGESISLSTKSAIYGYNTHSVAQSISVLEEEEI